MATDIGPSLTPTFDAVIPVPDDGDYANHDALVAMVAPLGNRTLYLQSLLEDAPWLKSDFFDDFFVDGSDIDTNRSLYDTLWSVEHTGAPSVSATLVVDATSIGVLNYQNSGGAITSSIFSKGVISGVGVALSQMTNFRRAVTRVRTGNITSGMNFEIGLDADGQHTVAGTARSITAIFQPSASPNWRLRTHNGVSAVHVDTGIAVAANTWYQLDLQSDGVSLVTLSIDGAAPVAANPANLPAMTTDCAFVMRYGTPAAGASRQWRNDFVYGRFQNLARVL